MKTTVVFGGEFTSLLSQLKQSPENPALKQAVLEQLPLMKALAVKNPFALYCLAQVYSERSSKYKQLMIQAAEAGCTNAMLAICKAFLKSQDLKQAAYYMQKIEASDDSYIKKQGKELLGIYPQLAAKVNPPDQLIGEVTSKHLRFFGSFATHQDNDMVQTETTRYFL